MYMHPEEIDPRDFFQNLREVFFCREVWYIIRRTVLQVGHNSWGNKFACPRFLSTDNIGISHGSFKKESLAFFPTGLEMVFGSFGFSLHCTFLPLVLSRTSSVGGRAEGGGVQEIWV